METWRFLAWTTALLILWAVLVSLLGFDRDPGSVLFATLFGIGAFYLSQRLVERFAAGANEEE